MPKVTKAHLEARKKQIIDAATACFSRKGFHRATMANICKEANLSPGAVYGYFKSKDDIIMRIAQENLQRNLDLILEIKERGGIRKKLHELADVFFSMLDEPGRCPIQMDIELWGEALRNNKIIQIVRRSFESHRRAFTEMIEQAQKKGEFNRSVNPESIAMVMISMFDGFVLQKAINKKVDVRSYVDTIKKMMDSMIDYSGD